MFSFCAERLTSNFEENIIQWVKEAYKELSTMQSD